MSFKKQKDQGNDQSGGLKRVLLVRSWVMKGEEGKREDKRKDGGPEYGI